MFVKYLRKELSSFCVLIIIGVIVSLLTSIVPFISGMFIDSLIYRPNMDTIYTYCIIFLFIMLFMLVIGYINSILGIRVKNNISYEFTRNIFFSTYLIHYVYIKGQNISYLSQRLFEDCNNITSYYIEIILGGISYGIQIIFISFLLIKINISIFILVIILNTIYWFLYLLFKNKIFAVKLELKEESDKLYSKFFEILKYFKLAKIFDITLYLKNRVDVSYKSYFNKSLKAQKIDYSFISIQTVMKYLAQIILFIYGGNEIINGNLTVGVYSIMAGYFTSLNESIKFFIDSLNEYISVKVSKQRINDILNLQENNSSKKMFDQKIRKITLNNLKIYNDSKNLIMNFSYEFKVGNSYCILGKNGSGKTTLIETIIGLNRDNYMGEIKINEININDLDMSSLLLNKISLLPQYTDIIEDTIVNNLIFKKNCYLKKVNDLKKIFLLNIGLEKNINSQSTNISGGEMKKIALIRTLLKGADVYIFDEPCASLDEHTKKIFYNYINELKENAIVIVISHEKKKECNYDQLINLEELK